MYTVMHTYIPNGCCSRNNYCSEKRAEHINRYINQTLYLFLSLKIVLVSTHLNVTCSESTGGSVSKTTKTGVDTPE